MGRLARKVASGHASAADWIKDLIFVLAQDEPNENDVERLEAARRKFENEMASWDAALSSLRQAIEEKKAQQAQS